MVIKNDELYMDLLVWHMEDSERLDELVNEGYLVRDGQLLTEKTVTFMDSYFEAKKQAVLREISKHGGYKQYIREIKETVEVTSNPFMKLIIYELLKEKAIREVNLPNGIIDYRANR